MIFSPSRRHLACIALASSLFSAVALADHHAEGEVSADPAAAETEAAMTETQPAPAEAVTEQAASTVAPSKYSCSHQGLVRRVEIAYATDTSVPCEVNYYKDSEAPNEVSTLWSAQNLEGYCEQKAAEFVDKLQSWGWACKSE